MTEALSTYNQEALKNLCRLLQLSQGEFSLILAVCNSTQHRRQLVKHLTQQCSISFDEINLDSHTDTLFTTIRKHIGNSVPKALMVYGLQGVQDAEQVLTATNQVREEFRQFPFPLVLWLTDNELKSLIRTAPDFYTWANSVIFKTPSSFFLNFISELIQDVWQHMLQAQENRFLSMEEIGLTATSVRCQELDVSLTALASQNIQISSIQSAALSFVRGRIANNSSFIAREYYERSLAQWRILLPRYDNDPKLQTQLGYVLFYLGLWWRNHAERNQRDFEKACNKANKYFAASVKVFKETNHVRLVAKYINYWAESLHRLGQWQQLSIVAQKALDIHKLRKNLFREAYAHGFLAEVALAKQDWRTAQNHAISALKRIQPIVNLSQSSNLSTKNVEFYTWLNSFHQSWYLLSLGKAQLQQNRAAKAIKILETARQITRPDYDPKLYSLILEQIQQAYFRQGNYLRAFDFRRHRDAIESRFNYRAFVGAGRLQPKQRITNPTLPDGEAPHDIIAASGRKHNVMQLVQRLSQDKFAFTIIYGPSGVGKSSLIEAGLVPALHQERWETRRVVPIQLRQYRNWEQNLANKITFTDIRSTNLAESDLPEIAKHALIEEIKNSLRKRIQNNQTIILIFDQFEEFFFACEQLEQRKLFYDFLSSCLKLPYIKIILSLREDYIHHLLECGRLTDLNKINNSILDKEWLYYLGNFSEHETKSVFNDLTYPTPYQPTKKLINQVVADLAGTTGEIRPIELQIVGAQLQSENITTLEKYLNWGGSQLSTKELLVQRYLNNIVAECGPKENQQLADVALYLLTDEKGTRPLKTEPDLLNDLQSLTNKSRPDRHRLSLILKILTRSGLVTEIPESPDNHYQLVHDYLAVFIRSSQQPLIARIEEEQAKRALAEQLQLKEQQKRVLAEQLQLKEQAKRVTAEQLQIEEQHKRLDAEKKAQKKIRRAIASGLLATSALIVGAAGLLWTQAREAANKDLLAFNRSMETVAETGTESEAVIEAIKAGQAIKSDFRRYLIGDTPFRTRAAMQKILNETKERKRLVGHKDNVLSIAFSHDGKTLASAGNDNVIKLWKVENGENFDELIGHSDKISALMFSQNEEILASASDDQTIKLWDTTNGELLKTLKGHDDWVVGIAFSPDDKTLASASFDDTIKLWDTTNGKLLDTLTGHRDSVLSVVFSPDGQTLASGSSDETIKLWRITSFWDTTNGQFLDTLEGHSDSVLSVAFSPNGEILASASDDNSTIIWDSRNSDRLTTLTDHENSVLSVAFSSDGKTLASGSSDETIKLWHLDISNGDKLNVSVSVRNTLKGHNKSIRNVVFSPDGKTLASAGDETVLLWHTQDHHHSPLQHTGWVRALAFSPDGKTLASASNDDDDIITLWSVQTREKLNSIGEHDKDISSIAFSPDGKILASASNDKTIKLWNPKTGQELKTLNSHKDNVVDITFSPNGKILASASDDKTIKLWNPKTGQELKTLNSHKDSVVDITFSPNGKIIASASKDETIKLWDSQTGQELKTIEGIESHKEVIRDLAFNPNGQILASASKDETIKLWNTNNGTFITTLEGHKSDVRSVVFSHDGKTLISSSDKTIKFWDVVDGGNELHSLKGHDDVIAYLDFSPNGEILASASHDRTVVLWDFTLESLIQKGCNQLRTYLTRQSPQHLRKLEICQSFYSSTLMQTSALTLIAEADTLIHIDNQETALELYQQASQWNKQSNFLLEPKERLKILVDFHEGIRLVEQKNINAAIAKFRAVKSLQPSLEQKLWEVEQSWSKLCHQGIMQDKAQDVLFACEEAVARAPYSNDNIDSLGLAYALTGNIPGAITNFSTFIERTIDEDEEAQRRQWVNALKEGENPFTLEVLESLHKE